MQNILNRLSNYLLVASIIAISAMMLHVTLDVFGKYTFNSPIAGTAELVAHYYMVAAVFLPLPLIELRNKGISVDLLYNRLHKSFQKIMLVISYSAQSIFYTAFGYTSLLNALEALSFKEYLSTQIIVVIWPASFFLPAAFMLALTISLLKLFQCIVNEPAIDQTDHHNGAEL